MNVQENEFATVANTSREAPIVPSLLKRPAGSVNVQVIASGSKSNCYAFCDGKATILIECGLPIQKTLSALNYKLPDAILVTHEHGDHAYTAKEFLYRGVDMFMTAGTAQALNLNRHNLHIITAGEEFTAAGQRILPVKVKHDATEPVNFIFVDAKILFLTDLGEVPENLGGKFRKVLIEANYDLPTLLGADINTAQKERVFENHLSIKQAINFLQTIGEPEEVRLIHLSKRHGNGKEFVERVKQETGFTNVFAS